MREFSDQDHDAILTIHDRWIAEEIAGNGLAVLQYCTDDVRWLVPGGREVVGKDAARQLLMSAGITIHSIATSDIRVEGSGGLAYKTAAYETRYVVEASGETHTEFGRHLWVLRRAGAEWKVALVTWQAANRGE